MILGLLAEFLLQFVIEVAAEFGLHAASDMAPGRNTMPVGKAAFGYVVLGLMLGWLSLLVFPSRLVPPSPVPGLSLVVPPILAGLGNGALAGFGDDAARESFASIDSLSAFSLLFRLPWYALPSGRRRPTGTAMTTNDATQLAHAAERAHRDRSVCP